MKGQIKSTSPAMQKAGTIAKYVVLSIWSIITLFPVVWVFMTAFKDNGQIFKGIDRIDEKIISDYDLIVITAAHTNVDYDMIQKNAQAIFDTRNAMKDIENRENIEVL